jgi:membrane-bound lytic murein transglycosylase B
MKKLLFSCLLLLNFAFANATQNSQVKQFMQQMSSEHQFDKNYLNQLFSHVVIKPPVINTSTGKPLEVMTWAKYRAAYLTPARIQAGIAFWQQNKNTLHAAAKEYGVPPSVIIGILGAETNYGKVQGNDPVLNTLANLSFNGNRRAKYFRSELTNYLLLCREYGFSPLSIKGSYAGAMGAPQFMPSAYRKYAVDFRGNGKADLMQDPQDIIASIANYLQKNGWQRGVAVAIPVKVISTADLPRTGFKPTYTATELRRFSIKPLTPLDSRTRYRFIELQGPNGPEYWLGSKNFYTITRYNASTNYAMAVYQIGQAAKAGI